jgi:hypothetical protein
MESLEKLIYFFRKLELVSNLSNELLLHSRSFINKFNQRINQISNLNRFSLHNNNNNKKI